MTNIRQFGPLKLLVLVALLSRASHAADAQPADDPVKLQLEVEAISTLSDLQLSSEQIDALRELASDATGKITPAAGHPDEDYSTAVKALRGAPLSGNEEKIDDAQKKLGDLRDKSDVELDPTVEMSDVAKTKAASAVKLLSPKQAASYLGQIADDVPDIEESIVDAINQAHDLSDADFQSERDDLANEIGILVGGVNPVKPPPIIQKVKRLLDHTRHLPSSDSAKTADLRTEAHDLAKGIDPIPCLRHTLERDMAELLSNPQLVTALDAWQKSTAAKRNNSVG